MWILFFLLATLVGGWAAWLWVTSRWRAWNQRRLADAAAPPGAQERWSRWNGVATRARYQVGVHAAALVVGLAGVAVFSPDSDTYVVRDLNGLFLLLGVIPGMYVGAAWLTAWIVAVLARRRIAPNG